MNKFNFRLPIAALALAVVFLGGAAYANHSWGGYHWARTSNPFTVRLGDNVSSAWDGVLAAASSDWSQSNVLDTAIVASSTKPQNCKPTTGRVEVCNSKYGNNGWLGIAQIWITGGGHITQGIVKMNDTYFNTAKYNTPAWRQFVTCQEVGHTFGLGHQDEIFDNPNLGTCMDYTNDPSRNDGAGNNIHPDLHDYEELEIIYGHLDGSTTLASSVTQKGSAAANGAGESEWGQAIRNDGNGRPSLFERDLGHGNKLYTFVIWAQD